MAEITLPYAPRAAFVPFHNRTEREAVLVCHRRAGKTVCVVLELILKCLGNPRKHPPPQYAFFYPTWKRAKDIAWPYLKYYATKVPGTVVREGDLSVEFVTGGKITLYGAANSRAVGLYLDGVVYDEMDEIAQGVVAEVAPALSDFKGWTVYAGMLKGRYNLWRRYQQSVGVPGIYTLCLRASETGIIPQEELERLRRPGNMGESAYEMQLECNPNASIANAIYGAQMDEMRKEGRVTRLSVDKASPLYAFADIGHSLTGDDWSWWFLQMVGRDILVHRYYARTGEIPAHYAGKVGQVEDELGVRCACVYLPHDGARKDRAGRSAVEDLEAAGLARRVRVVTRTPNVWDSINDLRALMSRMWIDPSGCSEPWQLGDIDMPSGLDCLDYYTKKVEEQTGLIRDVPVHNQYSHGADAMRTFAEAFAKGMLDNRSDFVEAREGFGVMEGIAQGLRRITSRRAGGAIARR